MDIYRCEHLPADFSNAPTIRKSVYYVKSLHSKYFSGLDESGPR